MINVVMKENLNKQSGLIKDQSECYSDARDVPVIYDDWANSLYNVNMISTLDVNLYYQLSAWDADKIPPERGLADRGLCEIFPVHPRCMFGFTGFVQQQPHHLIQVTIMWLSNDRSASSLH